MLSTNDRSTVPLTPEQRMWLRANSVLPVVSLLGVAGVAAVVGSCIISRFITAPLVALFALVVGALLLVLLVVVGRYAYQHYAALRLGVVYVSSAELIQKRATTQSPRSFSAEFKDLGVLTVMHEVYQSLDVGQRYRVTYSPHIRRGWSVEHLPTR
jgi:membrane protein implicated in regulation of membrane protease activity